MRRRLFCLAAVLALLLTACSQPSGEEGPMLYFPQATFLQGAALGSERAARVEPLTVDTLIAALLAGPSTSDLTSPFPAGVTLRSWYQDEGVLHINLSEQYGGLSGIALTLADYSITLTLCQLEGVEGVSITVENDPMPFRYRQILTPGDVLLTDLAENAQP